MCDEYEDERMVAFWRRLEQRESQASPETDENEDAGNAAPLLRVEPEPAVPLKAKPRTLSH